jgi:hypothetical protein
MIRKGLTLIGVVLVTFHVWLFGSQLWAGDLADLALVARWLIALGLVGALSTFPRRGLSMVRGRHAVALWVLAALLHGPALARDLDVTSPAMPEVVATAAQTLGSLAALGVVLLIGLAGFRRRPSLPLRRFALATRPVGPCEQARIASLLFAPRPPPLA